MKLIISLITLAFGFWGLLTWQVFVNHPNWFWGGLAIFGVLALGVAVWVARKVAKFIGWSFSNCIYLCVAIIILGVLSFKSIIPSFAGVISAVLLSGLFVVTVIRIISSKAHTSLIWAEVFVWLTGYKLRNIIQDNELVKVEKAVKEKSNRETIVGALRQLEYLKKDSEEAADHAIEEMPDETIENQVKCALNYLSSESVLGDTE